MSVYVKFRFPQILDGILDSFEKTLGRRKIKDIQKTITRDIRKVTPGVDRSDIPEDIKGIPQYAKEVIVDDHGKNQAYLINYKGYEVYVHDIDNQEKVVNVLPEHLFEI